jgi:elongation factor P
MLSPNELKKGDVVVLNNQPCEVLETSRVFKGRGHSTLQAKIKNLISGAVLLETFHPSDSFEEAEIKRFEAKFLYSHRKEFFFCHKNNPGKRFSLKKEQIESEAKFLKSNQTVEAIIFKDEVINISLPIKITFKVIEAPPGVQGNRAQPGNKIVVLENKTKVAVPLFIKEGDMVEVNTQTGQYVKRV